MSVQINYAFGYPGSGKSTFAAYLARKYLKKGITVYANFPIIGCYEIDPKKDLGTFQVQDALVLWDEASISANNRNFKDFPKTCIEFLKLHRHYNVEIWVFSQAYDDVDITIRRLCHSVYWIKPGILKWFTHVKSIYKTMNIIDGEIVDAYVLEPFFKTKIIWNPPCWNMFNSWDAPQLPSKNWVVFEEKVSYDEEVESQTSIFKRLKDSLKLRFKQPSENEGGSEVECDPVLEVVSNEV